MKDFLIQTGQFLHVLDDDNRLDLTDLAFIAIIAKIMFSSTVDFPAVVTLATVMVNKMHKRQTNMSDDSEQVKQMTQQISDLQNKVSPIIDQIKGAVK